MLSTDRKVTVEGEQGKFDPKSAIGLKKRNGICPVFSTNETSRCSYNQTLLGLKSWIGIPQIQCLTTSLEWTWTATNSHYFDLLPVRLLLETA